jgi:putative flippase GtrA
LQAGGQGFDPPNLHNLKHCLSNWAVLSSSQTIKQKLEISLRSLMTKSGVNGDSLGNRPLVFWQQQKNNRFEGAMHASTGIWNVATVVRFAFASGMGLVLDLLVFSALQSLSMSILLTNVTSSILGFSLVYFAVTRYTFRAKRSVANYSIFFIWYLSSIFLYSEMISVLVFLFTGLTPFQGKLITVPLSFGLNYLFNSWLFSNRRRSSK